MPSTLFGALSDAETTTSTVIQWLHDIVADRRDHIEVGADSQFSLRHLIPYPFRVAIQTVALSEGWPAEGFALEVGGPRRAWRWRLPATWAGSSTQQLGSDSVWRTSTTARRTFEPSVF